MVETKQNVVPVHRQILDFVGVEVSTQQAYTTKCVCGKKCSIYTTPENATWVLCQNCKFSGFSSEYVAEHSKVRKDHFEPWLISKGVTKDKARGLLKELNNEDFLALLELWKLARYRVQERNIGPGELNLLSSFDLYIDAKTTLPNLGILYASDIKQHFKLFPDVALKAEGLTKFKNFVVVPTYDIPGRLVRLVCIHQTGEGIIYVGERGQPTYSGGIGPIRFPINKENPVYVTDTFRQALQYQIRAYPAAGSWVYTVCGLEDTIGTSWELLANSEVIVLATNDIKRAIDKTTPILHSKIKETNTNTLDGWIAVSKSSQLAIDTARWNRHWFEVAKDWLFELPGYVHKRLSDLNLSGSRLKCVTDICTETEKQLLSGPAEVVREIEFLGVTIRETSEGYGLVRYGKLVTISNIRLSVLKIITEKENNKTWLVGNILHGTTVIPFFVDDSTIKSKNMYTKWLTARLAGTAVIPYINPAWVSKFMPICMAFSTPVRETVNVLHGWSKLDNVYLLPGMAVSDSRVTSRLDPRRVGLAYDVWTDKLDGLKEFVTYEYPKAVEYGIVAFSLLVHMLARIADKPGVSLAIGVGTESSSSLVTIAADMNLTNTLQEHLTSNLSVRCVSNGVIDTPVVWMKEPTKLAKWFTTYSGSYGHIVAVKPICAIYASLFKHVMSTQFPVTVPGVASMCKNLNLAQPAVRLACEAVSLGMSKVSGGGDLLDVAKWAWREAALKFGATELVDAVLGRVTFHETDPKTWCMRYIKTLNHSVSNNVLSADIITGDSDVKTINIHEAVRQLEALGVAHPPVDYVMRQFISANMRIPQAQYRKRAIVVDVSHPSQSSSKSVTISPAAPL